MTCRLFFYAMVQFPQKSIFSLILSSSCFCVIMSVISVKNIIDFFVEGDDPTSKVPVIYPVDVDWGFWRFFPVVLDFEVYLFHPLILVYCISFLVQDRYSIF